jgi:hypothetical protein
MSNFLELIAQEKNSEAMEFFNDMMAEKISGVLDQRKAELASNLFGGMSEQPTTEEQ